MGYDDPTSIGDIIDPSDRPNGRAAKCSACDAPGAWHSTLTGRRIFMEPRPVPAARVPNGKRWQIGPDGVATVRQGALGHCRITHFDVCPANPKPLGGLFLALWEKHRERQGTAGG